MSADDERWSGETDESLGRLPARRDRDRILYASEFRRLAGVTQVASATENLLIHNRITHSTKVEQVGTSIVAIHENANLPTNPRMGAAGEWRVAAAGLGHDLGHPPFGHIGEEVLDRILVCSQHRSSRAAVGIRPPPKAAAARRPPIARPIIPVCWRTASKATRSRSALSRSSPSATAPSVSARLANGSLELRGTGMVSTSPGVRCAR